MVLPEPEVYVTPTIIDKIRADAIEITAQVTTGMNMGVKTAVNQSEDIVAIAARHCIFNQAEACNRVANVSTVEPSVVRPLV